MQQVLFFIPIRAIAEWLPHPDLGFFQGDAVLIYLALGALAIGLSGWLDRRRNEGAATPSHGVKIAGSVLGVLLFLAGGIVLVGPNTPSQGVPIYGYGTMLFVAFVGCVWLASLLGV